MQNVWTVLDGLDSVVDYHDDSTFFVAPERFGIANPLFWVFLVGSLGGLAKIILIEWTTNQAFVASAVTIASQISIAFVGLFPTVPSTLGREYDLTAFAILRPKDSYSHAGDCAVGMPVVLAYTIWVFEFSWKVEATGDGY